MSPTAEAFRVVFQLAWKEILLPLRLLYRWTLTLIRNPHPKPVNGTNPTPGGIDHIFLAIIIFLLFTLLLTLSAVKDGLSDKMAEVLLGRVELKVDDTLTKALLPMLVAIDGPGLDEDLERLKEQDLILSRYGPVYIAKREGPTMIRGEIAIPEAMMVGRSPDGLEGRSVEANDPIWQAAIRAGGVNIADVGPFVIVLNRSRFVSTYVNFDEMVKVVGEQYSKAMAQEWQREAGIRPNPRITDLATAWVRIQHYPTWLDFDSAGDVAGPSPSPSTRLRYGLFPVRVVAVDIPGVLAPDFLISMDLARMIGMREAPERLGPSPWDWFTPHPDQMPQRCHSLQVDEQSRVAVRKLLVDLDGKPIGWAPNGRQVNFSDKSDLNRDTPPSPGSGLPLALIEERMKRLDSGVKMPGLGLCVPVPRMSEVERSAWRNRIDPPRRAFVYLDWEKRHTLPSVLAAFRPDSTKAVNAVAREGATSQAGTLVIKSMTVDVIYQDTANRLLLLTTILEVAEPWIGYVVVGVLFGFVAGCLVFIVQARRGRFALLLTQGLPAVGLWSLLALQLTFTVIVSGLSSVFLSKCIIGFINDEIVGYLRDTGVQVNLINALSETVSLAWMPAFQMFSVTLASLLLLVALILWCLGLWHTKSLGKHLFTG